MKYYLLFFMICFSLSTAEDSPWSKSPMETKSAFSPQKESGDSSLSQSVDQFAPRSRYLYDNDKYFVLDANGKRHGIMMTSSRIFNLQLKPVSGEYAYVDHLHGFRLDTITSSSYDKLSLDQKMDILYGRMLRYSVHEGAICCADYTESEVLQKAAQDPDLEVLLVENMRHKVDRKNSAFMQILIGAGASFAVTYIGLLTSMKTREECSEYGLCQQKISFDPNPLVWVGLAGFAVTGVIAVPAFFKDDQETKDRHEEIRRSLSK